MKYSRCVHRLTTSAFNADDVTLKKVGINLEKIRLEGQINYVVALERSKG